jgi:2-phosphoglycerate kinase
MNDRRPPALLALEDHVGLPYSRGLVARMLMGAGVRPARAYDLAILIRDRLTPAEARGVDGVTLKRVVAEVLAETEGLEAVERFARLSSLRELDVPVIVLIGGTTGAGKSSVATEVAHRLGITRVTSTDFLRQTMRAIIPAEDAPTLHRSSFSAGSVVEARATGPRDATIAGFTEQSAHVRTAIDAVLSRAHEERLSMVLEGVHLIPEQRPAEDALVVSCVVAIRDASDHARRFHHRDREGLGRRPAKRYLAAFNEIREIDDYLREAAVAAGVPVIENDNLETTIDRVIDLVLSEVPRVAPAAGDGALAAAG